MVNLRTIWTIKENNLSYSEFNDLWKIVRGSRTGAEEVK